jgi:hypothetical protein
MRVIAQSASDEAIQSLLAALDRFAEPGPGPRFARTRWRAMTASYFVSGHPLSFAVKKAFSPGMTASCL